VANILGILPPPVTHSTRHTPGHEYAGQFVDVVTEFCLTLGSFSRCWLDNGSDPRVVVISEDNVQPVAVHARAGPFGLPLGVTAGAPG
jgi:hypothetical protein